MEVMVYGNGESRKQFDKLRFMGNYTTWGCNAIYRDLNVDNLVSVDYAMQQEIYALVMSEIMCVTLQTGVSYQTQMICYSKL